MFKSRVALVGLLAVTVALLTSGCSGDELDRLHRTLPHAYQDRQINPWLDITAVAMSESGTVTVEGFLLPGEPTTGTAVAFGMSPRGRRLWAMDEVGIAGEEVTIMYRFGFGRSNAEPEPLEGHYILELSMNGDVQYVFIDFNEFDWVADRPQ